MSAISHSQRLGRTTERFGYSVLLGVSTIFLALTTVANGVVASSFASGFWGTFWAILAAVAIDWAKAVLPGAVYNAWYRAPFLAQGMLVALVLCLTFSLVCGFIWALSTEPAAVPAHNASEHWAQYKDSPLFWILLMLLAQAFSTLGFYCLKRSTQSATEHPMDEPWMFSRKIQDAPPQALPGPGAAPQIAQQPLPAISPFGDWVDNNLNLEPHGQLSLAEAMASYAAWAGPRNFPPISPHEFAEKMARAAHENGVFPNGEIFIGFSLASPHAVPVG